MAYGLPFERFIEPARYRPAIWRIIVGLVVLFVVYLLIAIAITYLGAKLFAVEDLYWLISPEAMAQPKILLWLLSTFLGMAVGACVAVWLLHRRSPLTLMGRGPRVLKDFAVTACVYLGLGLPLALGFTLTGQYEVNLGLSVWLTFLPFAIAAIALQTLAEELVFRGYLQQQLAARFNSPIIWMVLPSLMFGSLHFDPSAGIGSALGIVGVTTVFGLVAADLTARTGSLGSAWGFHFANNMLAMTIVSVDGTLNGLSLFKTEFNLQEQGLPIGLIVGDILIVLIGWFLTRRALGR